MLPVKAEGPFLSFSFKPSVLAPLVLSSILARKEQYGFNPTGKGKKVVVEFSSPNIAKPFHAGHLRSTIIGGFLSNLYEAFGWEVIRMNYLGDWGKQFGILAVGFKRFGSEKELEEDPIHHLYDVYVKINKVITCEKEGREWDEEAEAKREAELKAKKEEEERIRKEEEEKQRQKDIAEGKVQEKKSKKDKKKEKKEAPKEEDKAPEHPSPTNEEAKQFFVRMENGDEEALSLWRKFRDLSIEKYIDTYKQLNIQYDTYSGESQVKPESMQLAYDMMEKAGLLQLSQGAQIIDFAPYDKHLGKALIKKSDGTTLYLTRDIGAAIERYEKYKFDKMIYVVASQQDLHLAQLFKILELVKLPWAKTLQHINFGMVLGMSTRKGTVVFLDDILEQAANNMHEVMQKNQEKYAQVENPQEVASIVGRSAVVIQDMTGKRINNYEFAWARMLSFEGDTGPYLQYAHSRVCSILRKASIPYPELLTADYTLLSEPHAVNLIRSLAQYPDVLAQALRTHEPTTIVTYLFKMTHLLSSSYDVLRVVGEKDRGKAVARMALYEAARVVLNNGMRLVGLTPVERM